MIEASSLMSHLITNGKSFDGPPFAMSSSYRSVPPSAPTSSFEISRLFARSWNVVRKYFTSVIFLEISAGYSSMDPL